MDRSFLCLIICTFILLIPLSSAEQTNMTADEHYLMANAYSAFGQYENATKEYQTALKIRPDYPDAWNNLGIVLNKQEKYNESLLAAQNATRYNPDDAEAWYNKGYTLGMLGRYDEEIDSYKQALSIRSNLSSAWENMGVAYFDKKMYPEAAGAFLNETSHDPHNAIAWYYLGTVYEKMEKLPDAISSYEKAENIQPNLTIVKERLKSMKNNETSKSGVNPVEKVNNSTNEKTQPLQNILEFLKSI
jgi:tetratricopeptide (TPR) repeat protein